MRDVVIAEPVLDDALGKDALKNTAMGVRAGAIGPSGRWVGAAGPEQAANRLAEGIKRPHEASPIRVHFAIKSIEMVCVTRVK